MQALPDSGFTMGCPLSRTWVYRPNQSRLPTQGLEHHDWLNGCSRPYLTGGFDREGQTSVKRWKVWGWGPTTPGKPVHYNWLAGWLAGWPNLHLRLRTGP